MGAERIIEEDPVGQIIVQAYVERDSLVERVLVLAVGVLVGHPVLSALTLQVRMGRLVSQSVKRFSGLGNLAHFYCISPELIIFLPVKPQLVFIDHTTFKVFNANPQVGLIHKNTQLGGQDQEG